MIRILPVDEIGRAAPPVSGRDAADPLAWAVSRRFMASGRFALDTVLRRLGLQPDDEVLITNSSGQTYVSSCVTCAVFNHCKPSRVLTGRTRAILVIHEYGYPHPKLRELCGVARNRSIPLIEDCAHSLDSVVGGAPLGSLGDYAIFSLSKVLPVRIGGILVGWDGDLDMEPERADAAAEAEAAYGEHLSALAGYSRRRRENYEAVRDRFLDLPLFLEADAGVTPFFIGLVTRQAREIRRRSTELEWGSTLREDLLLVTTNPFVEAEALVEALQVAFEQREPV